MGGKPIWESWAGVCSCEAQDAVECPEEAVPPDGPVPAVEDGDDASVYSLMEDVLVQAAPVREDFGWRVRSTGCLRWWAGEVANVFAHYVC